MIDKSRYQLCVSWLSKLPFMIFTLHHCLHDHPSLKMKAIQSGTEMRERRLHLFVCSSLLSSSSLLSLIHSIFILIILIIIRFLFIYQLFINDFISSHPPPTILYYNYNIVLCFILSCVCILKFVSSQFSLSLFCVCYLCFITNSKQQRWGSRGSVT